LIHSHSLDNEAAETTVAPEDSYYHHFNLSEVHEQPFVSYDAGISLETYGDYSLALSGASSIGWELNAHKILVSHLITSGLEIQRHWILTCFLEARRSIVCELLTLISRPSRKTRALDLACVDIGKTVKHGRQVSS
jgi:hypothetical protein